MAKTNAVFVKYVNNNITTNTDSANPIPAANLLGAWSIGLLGILNCFTTNPLKIFSGLYFPKLKARKKKSIAKKIKTGNEFVKKDAVTNNKTHNAVNLTLFSLTVIKSTGHSFSITKY